jgi:gliding motility-associated protein GldM
MSIPKEPRQLMINLMYLVLTAMLALNVSAEIINAFFALNKGIKDSNSIVEKSNVSTKAAIDKQVKAYPNATNQGFGDNAVKAQAISKEFETYINDILAKLVEAAGGPNPKYTDGRPVRYKDKDVTTRMFLNEKLGEQIQQKIEETRKKFIALVGDSKDRAEIEKQIALLVDAIPADSKAKTWSEYKFKQMPVAAVMPQLTKLSADAKTSETALLNYFLNKVGGETIKIDNFLVAFAPKKGYINRGDKFEAEVYLAGYSSNPGAGVSIQVNGTGVSVVNGKGQFSESPQSLGKRKITATGSIRNPLTGQIQNASPAEFEYEVGESSATVSAEKMNVFYVGVTNPIAVSVAGVSSSNINVSCDGCSLSKRDANNYDATVSVPNGEAIVRISGGGINYSKKFRRKAIPDPSPRITVGDDKSSRGGMIQSGTFSVNNGLIAELKNFDFDAKCSIQSYSLVRVPRREDPQQANVSGPSNSEAERLQRMARPGDTYQFMEIKARCPGDQVARSVGSMSFFIR